MGVSKLMDLLGDSREVIRNDVSWDKCLHGSTWSNSLLQNPVSDFDLHLSVLISGYGHSNQLYMIYLSTAIGLTPGGRGTVYIYTQTIHRTTQIQTVRRTTQITTNLEECGPCPIFASFTLAFALQLRKKHVKTSVRVAEEWNSWKTNMTTVWETIPTWCCASICHQSQLFSWGWNNTSTIHHTISKFVCVVWWCEHA